MEKSNGKFSIGPTVTGTQSKTLAIAKVPVNIKSPVAHKTGTSLTIDGVTAATNDVGFVTLPNGRHLAISVFVPDSGANNAVREEVIAKVAKAAWDEWSK